MNEPFAHFASQPNLNMSATKGGWSHRFWLVTVVTGVAAGIAGGLLMRLLGGIEHFVWNFKAGTLLEAAAGDSKSRHILVLLCAGMIVGVVAPLIRKLLGRPGEVEAGIWFRSGRMPTISTITQAIYSIVTVAMGTSLGRESSIKQTGGAIASRLAQSCRLTRAEERLLVACGVGAGMAAAYNVPVGGALFAVEVLLGCLSLRLVLPALICSGVATAASWTFLPTGPVYRVPEFPLTIQLTVWALIAGPLLGLATVPLIRVIGWADAHKPKGLRSGFVTPVLFLTALGGISIAFPQLLGNGKDAVQIAFSDQFGISLLLLLPLLKLIATAGCLGSGASGGLFTPTMTIGALLGGLFGHAWNHVWPGASMGSCSVIGSCAFLAAASEGPISALVIVLELTRHIDATMVPMLIAVIGAMWVARWIEPQSIYSIRLHLRKLGQQLATAKASTHFDDLITKEFKTLSSASSYGRVARELLLLNDAVPVYILDHRGELLGQITRSTMSVADLGAMPLDSARAADLFTTVDAMNSGMTKQQVLDRLRSSACAKMPVIDERTGQMIGVVKRHSDSSIAVRPEEH